VGGCKQLWTVIGRAGVKAKRIGIYKFNRIKFSQHFASAIVVSSVRLTFIWALTNIRVMFMRNKCKMINVPFMLQTNYMQSYH